MHVAKMNPILSIYAYICRQDESYLKYICIHMAKMNPILSIYAYACRQDESYLKYIYIHVAKMNPILSIYAYTCHHNESCIIWVLISHLNKHGQILLVHHSVDSIVKQGSHFSGDTKFHVFSRLFPGKSNEIPG